MANDLENQNLLDEQLVATTEPDEAGRWAVIVLLGVLTLLLTVVAWVLIDVYLYDNSPHTTRLTVAAFVVGMIVATVAACAWVVFLCIIGEREIGNPEGFRFVTLVNRPVQQLTYMYILKDCTCNPRNHFIIVYYYTVKV